VQRFLLTTQRIYSGDGRHSSPRRGCRRPRAPIGRRRGRQRSTGCMVCRGGGTGHPQLIPPSPPPERNRLPRRSGKPRGGLHGRQSDHLATQALPEFVQADRLAATRTSA
jgi:hypothetical protein